MMSKAWRALKPDAQAFDRIEIITVPRYKTSGLSGDEWRISGQIIFYRKGKEIHRIGSRNIETCARHLAYWYDKLCDEGHAFFGGEGGICDQEGCDSIATVRADMIANYCQAGHRSEPTFKEYRLFCDRHKTRGDCGLDDADRNYIFTPIAEREEE